jgi:hypothetical protein
MISVWTCRRSIMPAIRIGVVGAGANRACTMF